MDAAAWWTFFIGTALICATPGPNMLQVMHCSARYGLARAMLAMAGCFIPVFAFICISLAGVGVLLQVFPLAFDVLRYLGAGYLIYLGVMAWRSAPTAEAEAPAISRKGLFARSVLVGLSNPKALLFATAYFPQFLDPSRPQALQYAVLLATFSVCEIACYLIYAGCGSRLRAALEKASVQRVFNRLTGGLFVFFGIALIAKNRMPA